MTHDDIENLRAHYDTTDTSEEMSEADIVRGSTADPTVSTSVRMPWSVMKAVRAVAARRGAKPTALMREWIEAGLAEEIGDEKAVVPVAVLRAAFRSAVAEYLASQQSA